VDEEINIERIIINSEYSLIVVLTSLYKGTRRGLQNILFEIQVHRKENGNGNWILKGSNDGVSQSKLLGLSTFSIVWYSRY
jgi:hypothetical protein